ncbi:prenyltransferase [Komarekiella sp. 'clone 1']|uniref:Prenyltransferase n=1 Tax=Komarekiella delphini-convector SJRDD-AB1 TaxID=2593771 RepID=A0AA40T1S2_9NOST|nr:UbiA family prenyltransferase [Komarekiella delphini-convector]MBD6619160.1 prenyltransferase [Komarekiella delphini-convector SJRDD-AB1]
MINSAKFQVLTQFSSSLIREPYLIWLFIKRDYSTTILPALLFIIAAWKNSQLSFGELFLALERGFIYFLLFILSFCIANQIVGIDEDRINKPDRPLVTGAVSYHGALVRLAFSQIAFSLIGMWFGVLEWALLWQLFTFLYHFAGWDKNWFTKGLVIGVGAVAELAAAWEIVTPITPIAWRWIFMMGVFWTTLVAVQDFRDMEGDRAIGRKTLPMVIGETASRVILCLGFTFLPLVIHLVLMMPAGNTLNVLVCELGLTVLCWIIATRIMLYRNPQADHHTYMLLTYWFCLVLASAIIIL